MAGIPAYPSSHSHFGLDFYWLSLLGSVGEGLGLPLVGEELVCPWDFERGTDSWGLSLRLG